MLTAAATSLAVKQFEVAIGQQAHWRDFEPHTWALKLIGDRLRSIDLAEAEADLFVAYRLIAQWMDQHQYDVILTPTLSAPPLKIGAHHHRRRDANLMQLIRLTPFLPLSLLKERVRQSSADAFSWMSITPVFNVTGQLAMNVPVNWNNEGLPIGSHFVARLGQEERLYSLAGQIEKACPWANKKPRIHSDTSL